LQSKSITRFHDFGVWLFDCLTVWFSDRLTFWFSDRLNISPPQWSSGLWSLFDLFDKSSHPFHNMNMRRYSMHDIDNILKDWKIVMNCDELCQTLILMFMNEYLNHLTQIYHKSWTKQSNVRRFHHATHSVEVNCQNQTLDSYSDIHTHINDDIDINQSSFSIINKRTRVLNTCLELRFISAMLFQTIEFCEICEFCQIFELCELCEFWQPVICDHLWRMFRLWRNEFEHNGVQSINQSIHQSINRLMYICMDGWMNRWIDEWNCRELLKQIYVHKFAVRSIKCSSNVTW
jgi:hypothetical protein